MPRSALRLLLAAVTSLVCYSPLHGAAEQGVSPETTVFELVRENPSVNGERRQVMQFESDGLLQFALVLWPAGQAPEGGWPGLLLNHGYHPDPPAYGRNAAGKNDRPGDYYRGMAQAYVDRGLVVVVPDFRGHNESEGISYTTRDDAPLFYARDAAVAFRAMESLPGLNRSRRYMLGHSMGGRVAMEMARQAPERRFLEKRLAELG